MKGRITLKPWTIGGSSWCLCLTRKRPRMCSHLEGCWQLSEMFDSCQSPCFQRNQRCFSCSSVNPPTHKKKVCIIKWYSFLKGETCTLTETSTYIHRINLLHWGQLFHWVDLLLADEVGDGRHWPLTPVLPLHHHPIAEQLQCWILGDAVALSYVRCAQAEGERKLSKERNQLMKSEKKSKNTWGWVDGERRGDGDSS